MFKEINFSELLRSRGLKVTKDRLFLLSVIKKSKKPISIPTLIKSAKKIDRATIYRNVKVLLQRGVLQEVSLGHAHAHVELVENTYHHHHVICEGCGSLKDIEVSNSLESLIKKEAKKHKAEIRHTLDFYTNCVKCKIKNEILN